jgi:hypothetical protein
MGEKEACSTCNETDGSIERRTEDLVDVWQSPPHTTNNTTLHNQRINSPDIFDQSGFVSGKQVVQRAHMLVPCPPTLPTHPHTPSHF